MRTQKKVVIVQDEVHELDSEVPDADEGYIGNNLVFAKISSSVTEAGNNLHIQFQRMS